jgi:hypothetical protein
MQSFHSLNLMTQRANPKNLDCLVPCGESSDKRAFEQAYLIVNIRLTQRREGAKKSLFSSVQSLCELRALA